MKKLLLLGGSKYLLPAIEAAHNIEGGVHVITCDYLPDNVAHKYSDEYHNVSIVDKEAVLNLARELKIDGILSFATDPGVVTAAYVAEKMGLVSSASYESVRIMQNKDLFRDFLERNGFNCPKHIGYDNKEDAMKGVNEFSFPIVIKPVDSAGSKGVTKVTEKQEIEQAIDCAFENSISKKIIIEQFIALEGCQSGSDSFVKDGKLVFASFDSQFYDLNAPNPFTPAAMCYPSNMPMEKQIELRAEIQRLVDLLGIRTTILNIECRVGTDGKAYLMEVSPRAGGNRVTEILRLATGTDLIKNDVRNALGLSVEDMTDPVYDGSYTRVILHSYNSGTVKDIVIDKQFEEKYVVEKDIWVKPGDKVNAFTGANQSLGILFLKFPTWEIAKQYVTDMDSWLKIVLN